MTPQCWQDGFGFTTIAQSFAPDIAYSDSPAALRASGTFVEYVDPHRMPCELSRRTKRGSRPVHARGPARPMADPGHDLVSGVDELLTGRHQLIEGLRPVESELQEALGPWYVPATGWLGLQP